MQRAPCHAAGALRAKLFYLSHHHPYFLPLGTRLGRPHPASRRLLPSLRELIAFPFERTSGRHSRKCQRLFQWRIDGCRELTGNWFSPRGAVGTRRGQYLISAVSGEGCERFQRHLAIGEKTNADNLTLSPAADPLHASLLVRPRWKRRRDSQPNRRLARKKRELKSVTRAPSHAADALRAKPFFHRVRGRT